MLKRIVKNDTITVMFILVFLVVGLNSIMVRDIIDILYLFIMAIFYFDFLFIKYLK